MTREQTLKALVAALVVANLAMVLVFIGAAGASHQARRALEPGALWSCTTAANAELRWEQVPTPPDTAQVRFAGADTVRFEVSDFGDRSATLTCRFAEPTSDTDGTLPLRSVEVTS